MNSIFLAASRRLTRHLQNGKTIKTTTTRWMILGWAVAIFPIVGHTADSLIGTTLEDTKLYFTSPLRWDEEDWLYFGGALAAVAAAHSLDERVRDHFATGSKATLNGGEDKNSLRDAAPTVALIAGTGLYAAFIDDHVARNGEQPCTRRALGVADHLGMLPGAEQRLLYHVFGATGITGQPKRVTPQRPSVLVI